MSTRTLAAAALLSCAAAISALAAVPHPDQIPRADVVFVIENHGNVRVRLDPSAAPNHCAQFLSLANTGRYRGSTFHRVIPGFVAQAGIPVTPTATPMRVPEESSTLAPVRGAVAMAWRGCTAGTAETEWFVCLDELPALSRCGTVIGRVVSGMDVIDKIAQASTDPAGKPLRAIIIQDVRLVDPADSSQASAPNAAG